VYFNVQKLNQLLKNKDKKNPNIKLGFFAKLFVKLNYCGVKKHVAVKAVVNKVCPTTIDNSLVVGLNVPVPPVAHESDPVNVTVLSQLILILPLYKY
jgi:hypothetical protein